MVSTLSQLLIHTSVHRNHEDDMILLRLYQLLRGRLKFGKDNPVRYEYSLTQIGQDLEPVLLEINRWGKNNIEGIRVPKDEELEQFQKKYSRDRK